jgi:hypothetical protein
LGGSSLPLPALPSDEPLPLPFEPLGVRVFDPLVLLRLREVALLPVPVVLPLPASLAEVGTVVSGALGSFLLSLPLVAGAPDPGGVCGEPVRSGSFVRGGGGLPGTVEFGDVALLLSELLGLYELL